MARRSDGQTASRDDTRITSGHEGARRSVEPNGIDPELVEIRPEPSQAERAAILIALEQILEATRIDAPRPTAWALAGRRESSRPGGAGELRTGWGRGSDRLDGW
ncbi:MAG: hypothetical protein KY456_00345 [Chloroflexi bacterium]|nr:hypothetical protein [Chloroflexota bacterium]